LQVSGVSDFSWNLINDLFGRLFFCWWLLDWLGNQLVGDFGFSVYTNKICQA